MQEVTGFSGSFHWEQLTVEDQEMLFSELPKSDRLVIIEAIKSHHLDQPLTPSMQDFSKKNLKIHSAKKIPRLEAFLNCLIGTKNMALGDFAYSFPYSGLYPAATKDPVEKYHRLNVLLTHIYEDHTLTESDLFSLKVPEELKTEHLHALKIRIKEDLESSAEISISGVRLNDGTLQALGEVLKEFKGPQYDLRLTNCGLTETQLLNLKAIVADTPLVNLNLSQNDFGDKGMDILMEIATAPKSIVERLILNENGITDIGAVVLLPFLDVDRSVRLELANNGISQELIDKFNKKAEDSMSFSTFLG